MTMNCVQPAPLQRLCVLTAVLLVLVFSFQSCKKEKDDRLKDNRAVPSNRAASATRIINLGGYTQVIANGEKLTSFIFREPNDPDALKYPGTDYFPDNGRLGSTWQIPQDLFKSDGTLQLTIAQDGANGIGPELNVKDDYHHPKDYYMLYPKEAVEGQPEYVTVERSATQPSRPDHFKIRIINLCATARYPIISPRGQLEDLKGPLSLTYADGTPVSDKTSNIAIGPMPSEYVELPYGTYQFRVLTADGRQVPGAGPVDPTNIVIDPPTSSIGFSKDGLVEASHLTFAPISTFLPGGVYTIVVSNFSFAYLMSASEQTSGALQNAFRVITDVSPSPNTTYYRLQGVHALPGQEAVSFRVNGKELDHGIPFGEASSYGSYISGNARIEAVNAAGTTLASFTQDLRPAQNYSAWLYPDAQGNAKLTLVINDLNGPIYSSGSGNNGSNSGPTYKEIRENFIFNKRFLNFSPDNPYITFTFGNGQMPSKPTINLQPGVPLMEQPYARGGALNYQPYEYMAYRSTPDVVPGIWAQDIEVLNSKRFIARKALYEIPGRELPSQEAGIFTIAVIGRTGISVPDRDKARMIIIKHNR